MYTDKRTKVNMDDDQLRPSFLRRYLDPEEDDDLYFADPQVDVLSHYLVTTLSFLNQRYEGHDALSPEKMRHMRSLTREDLFALFQESMNRDTIAQEDLELYVRLTKLVLEQQQEISNSTSTPTFSKAINDALSSYRTSEEEESMFQEGNTEDLVSSENSR